MSVIIFGPPGAGKGTQGKLICERLNYSAIIAGDLLRAEKRSGSQLGKEISSIIDKGNLVPDDMIDSIISNRVSELGYSQGGTKGYLFDGYPRSLGQASTLDYLYERYIIMEPVDCAILLEVPEDILVSRIMERGETSGREDDQDESIVRNRFRNYRKETEPIAYFYENQGKLITVDGNRDVEEIFNDIKPFIKPPEYGK